MNNPEDHPKENEAESFVLEDSAQKLYEQFEGIDDSIRVAENLVLESELMEFLRQEEKKLDQYRLLLAKVVCLFADIISTHHHSCLDKVKLQKLKSLTVAVDRIAESSDISSRIFCSFRGQECFSEVDDSVMVGSEVYDYEMSFGSVILDLEMAQVVEQREVEKGKSLYKNLLRAFMILSNMKIYNFSIDVTAVDDDDRGKDLNVAIQYLIKFYHDLAQGDGMIVRDEYDQPNINLTLLATTNGVHPRSVQKLVDDIKPKLFGAGALVELSRFTTVFDVIFATKIYRQKLKKMALDVNNVQRLMLKSRLDPLQKAEAVKVSRLVLSKYGSDPIKASEIISSISSEGYRKVKTDVLGKRLSLATEYFNLLEGDGERKVLQEEALKNIETGLDKVPDEVFDRVSIDKDEVSAENSEGNKTKWPLHKKILGLLGFFKQRSVTRKKIWDIASRNVVFDEEDYEVIARNFKIATFEASHLVSLLKGCFDENGRFRRNSFERSIPEFLRYESTVFEFLWHYLKELQNKDERISFLNAIQDLVINLKRPQEALVILLDDIFTRSTEVVFSDRNGLILGNILLRKYNKEKKSNVELTPDEVLQVRDGLSQDMVAVATEFLKKNREHAIQKTRMVTEFLLKSSARKSRRKNALTPRFLLALKREIVIFFSLIGGKTSQSIIRGVVREFGDPKASFYKTNRDKACVRHAMQLLLTSARGLKRFEDSATSDLLATVAGREKEFFLLDSKPAHRKHVSRGCGHPEQCL